MVTIGVALASLAVNLLFPGLHSVNGFDFGYDGNTGPSHWAEQYNSCAGKFQSPINIDVSKVVHKPFQPLVMTGFNRTPASAELSNNGHTVMGSLRFADTPTIQGGPLKGESVYKYSQFHFHWGDNNTFGSEDRINDKAFPAELHMVVINELYDSVAEASAHPDGVAVLAFFFSLQEPDNPNYAELTELLTEVREPNTKVSFARPPKLNDLIASNIRDYFTYIGSLTTPPCSETIVWIDFEEPILISAQQIDRFRSLYTSDGHPLKHNFRPIQPLNNRTVYKASAVLEPPSSVFQDIQGAEQRNNFSSRASKANIQSIFNLIALFPFYRCLLELI